MAAVAYMDTPGPVVAPTEVPTVTPTVVRAVSPAVASDVASVVVPVDTELPITLECSLCPKKPKFSDSSHLLTHISSKAHLHQKFSTELKAKSDAAASDRLEKYEKWYSVNGIELLLAERLSTKSRGKAAPRRSRAAATPVSSLTLRSLVSSLFVVISGEHLLINILLIEGEAPQVSQCC